MTAYSRSLVGPRPGTELDNGIDLVFYAAADRSSPTSILGGATFDLADTTELYIGLLDDNNAARRVWWYLNPTFLDPYHDIIQPVDNPKFNRGDGKPPYDLNGGPTVGNAFPLDISSFAPGDYVISVIIGMPDKTYFRLSTTITIVDTGGGGGGTVFPTPGVPGNLTANVSVNNRVTLTWTSSSDATEYQIRHSASNPPSDGSWITVSSGTTWVSGFTPAGTQYAQVRANGLGGINSDASAAISFTVTNPTPVDPGDVPAASPRSTPWATQPGDNRVAVNMLTQGSYLTNTNSRAIPGGPYRSNMNKDAPASFASGLTTPSTASNSKQQALRDRWASYIERQSLRNSQLPSNGGFPSHFDDTLSLQDVGGYIAMGTQASWRKGSAQGYPRNSDSIIDMAKQAAGVYDGFQTAGAQALYDTTVGGMAPGEWQRRMILTIYEFNAPWFAYYAGQDTSLRTDTNPRNAIQAVTLADLNGNQEIYDDLQALLIDGTDDGQNGDRSVLFCKAVKRMAQTVHAICPDVMFDIAFANPGAEPANQQGTTLSRDFTSEKWIRLINTVLGPENLDFVGYDYYCRSNGRPFWNGSGSINDPDNYSFTGAGSLDEGLVVMDEIIAGTNRILSFPEVGFCRALTGSGPSGSGSSDIQTAAAIKYMYDVGGVIDSRTVGWHNWFHRSDQPEYRYDINSSQDPISWGVLIDLFPSINSAPNGTFVGGP